MKTYMIASIIITILATSVAQADSAFSTNKNELIRSCFDIKKPFTASTSSDLTENDRLEEMNNALKSKLTCCLHGDDFHPGQNNVTVMCENAQNSPS